MGSPTIECIVCGWQGREADTDAMVCPDCGGETLSIEESYPDALATEPHQHGAGNERNPDQ